MQDEFEIDDTILSESLEDDADEAVGEDEEEETEKDPVDDEDEEL